MGPRESGIIDTTVFIDIIRKFAPALEWSLKNRHSVTTTFTIMELIQGATNKRDQLTAIKVVREFGKVYPVPSDYDWAEDQLGKYYLSHNVGMYDCLIASVSYRLQIPLYTHNLKHMKPILGDLAMKPY